VRCVYAWEFRKTISNREARSFAAPFARLARWSFNEWTRSGGRLGALDNVELFSRTFENRFIFNLFDLLLCGIIALVILRAWRAQAKTIPVRNQFLLLLAFSCLGASFATKALFSGAFIFFRYRLPTVGFESLFHVFQAGTWLLLAASVYQTPRLRRAEGLRRTQASLLFLVSLSPLLVLPGWLGNLTPKFLMFLDLTNICLIAFTLVHFYRTPLGGRRYAAGALALFLLAASLHFVTSLNWGDRASLVFWNSEQFGWSISLFTCALAIGETSSDLFDKVFVRLQITFILLASLMLLVITQSEKSDYFASISGRADQLAELVRNDVDNLRQQDEPLSDIVARDDLHKAIRDFDNLPELKIVRIVADNQIATINIADNRDAQTRTISLQSTSTLPQLDPQDYFLIHVLPLKTATGEVSFYGTREFLDQHIRRRIVLIFTLFTATVGLSTLMIGLVVRGASGTIRGQAREIEKAYEQICQSSKLAAIGELAAGVAHEINNPATTILSLSSFWVTQNGGKPVAVDPEDLKEVMTQAHRIARITTSLLEFSRPQIVEMKPIPLDRVINVSLRLVDDLLTANRISVQKRLPRKIMEIRGDEDSLVRALENLFRNAIDAMPNGGVLSLSVSEKDQMRNSVRLEIADTGVGIRKNQIARVFDPFFTTKEVGKGTGLGLSIVHGIIKEHQGTINIESEPGLGSKFTIVLPTED
jgi:signal transduction histidine kinase